jgi:pilus assembly protein CpaC
VPILGALFRSTDYQHDRTELVFVITARLVKPLAGASYQLPTDKVGVPSRLGVIVGGQLEGEAPAKSTAAASLPALPPSRSHSESGFELK